jgi:hypothetical protein
MGSETPNGALKLDMQQKQVPLGQLLQEQNLDLEREKGKYAGAIAMMMGVIREHASKFIGGPALSKSTLARKLRIEMADQTFYLNEAVMSQLLKEMLKRTHLELQNIIENEKDVDTFVDRVRELTSRELFAIFTDDIPKTEWKNQEVQTILLQLLREHHGIAYSPQLSDLKLTARPFTESDIAHLIDLYAEHQIDAEKATKLALKEVSTVKEKFIKPLSPEEIEAIRTGLRNARSPNAHLLRRIVGVVIEDEHGNVVSLALNEIGPNKPGEMEGYEHSSFYKEQETYLTKGITKGGMKYSQGHRKATFLKRRRNFQTFKCIMLISVVPSLGAPTGALANVMMDDMNMLDEDAVGDTYYLRDTSIKVNGKWKVRSSDMIGGNPGSKSAVHKDGYGETGPFATDSNKKDIQSGIAFTKKSIIEIFPTWEHVNATKKSIIAQSSKVAANLPLKNWTKMNGILRPSTIKHWEDLKETSSPPPPLT